MSKETTSLFSPDRIGVDLVTTEEDNTYTEATKGFIHAFVIPFILMWIHPLVATAYFGTVAVLYSTVFRKRSQGFWGTVLFVMLIGALLVVS